MEKYLSELADARCQLPKKKAEKPFLRNYESDMDETPALDHDIESWYQSLIEMLRWMVGIGIVDIITEVSIMESHTSMHMEGHLDMVLHLFAFLRQNYNSSMTFNPTYPVIYMNDFKGCKWKYFYGYLKEAIPSNAPEERGEKVDIRVYVDSNQAEEKNTRRS